ncbi:MAG: PAS domain S-box protein [Gammaproteobacteria bacterium]|nr:PAS domain S-box protein [Gammaproteobacteria bacterium]
MSEPVVPGKSYQSSMYWGLYLIVFVAMMGLAYLAQGLYQDQQSNQLRASVLAEFSSVRARLEGELIADFQLSRGLASVLATTEQLTQAKFERFARPLFSSSKHLKNVGAAPDMVLSFIHPLKGNEQAVGLNYLKIEAQRAGAERARDSGEMVVAGPLQLVQGGTGLIARFPIFKEEETSDTRFWGLLSVVIDIDKVYQEVGFAALEQDYYLALAHVDETGPKQVFYGPASIQALSPLTFDVAIPGQRWQLSVAPKSGWYASDSWLVIALLYSVAALIAVLIIIGLIFYRRHRAAENRLQVLFELSPLGIALVNSKSLEVIECNRAFAKPLGYPVEQIRSKTLSTLTPEKYKVQDLLQYKKLEDEGAFGPYEKELIRQDSSLVPVELSGISFVDSDGERYIWSILEDLSYRRIYERVLRANADQLSLVMESTAVGIWDWQVQTGEVTFNERWADIIGYQLHELRPISINTWLDLAHPEDLKRSQANLEKHWQGLTERYVCESRMRHRQGHWVWVLDTGRVVEWNEDGTPKRMIGTHIDITERKETEQALQRSMHEIEAFFNTSPVVNCIFSTDGTFERVNPAFEQILGVSESELREQPFRDWLHPDDREKSQQAFKQLRNGEKFHGFVSRVVSAAGEVCFLSWSGSLDSRGEKIYAAAIDISERIESEREIKRLSKIAAQTSNGVLITNTLQEIEWCNAAFEKITGYPLDEIKGKKPKEFLQGELTDRATTKRIAIELSKGNGFSEELVNYHKDGTPYWIRVQCSPLTDDEGKLTGFMAFERDVTKEKENQKLLEEQQKTLENMSALARIGAWELNLFDNNLYWSNMTKKIHEVDESYVPNVSTAINFYKEGYSRDTIERLVERCVEHGEPYEVELQIVTAKGRDLWVLAKGDGEFVNGECRRIFGSFQDIDQRKRAEIEARKTAKMNQAIAELTVDKHVQAGEIDTTKQKIVSLVAKVLGVERCSLWMFDESRENLTCISIVDNDNHSVADGMILSRADYPNYFSAMLSRSFISAVHAKEEPETKEFVEWYLNPLGIESLLDAVIPGGDGIIGVICAEKKHQKRYWTQSEQSFLISIGILIGGIFITQQRRETQQYLIEAKNIAENAAKMKSEFLASMSHEIRTPMNGVLGMLSLLRQQNMLESQQHQVNLAYNSAEALLLVINDILDFSKIEAGKLEIENVEFNLLDFLGSVIESFALKAEEQNIELVLDTSQVSFLNIVSDPARLRQVLNNLIGNALKFTEEGYVRVNVYLESNQGGEQLRVQVLDTGIGISNDKLEHLFDAFTQADASTTRRYGGSGLGLAIVKRLCQLMGGEISVSSELGGGSTFDFYVTLKGISRAVENTFDSIQGQTLVLACEPDQSYGVLQSELQSVGAQVEHWHEALIPAARGYVILDEKFYLEQQSELNYWFDQQRHNIHKIVLLQKISGAQDGLNSIQQIEVIKLFKPVKPHELFRCLMGKVSSSHTPADTAQEQPQSTINRVLLVEDNRVNQTVAVAMLKKLGVTATIASNGLEALEALSKEHAYQLILMDCQMPQMDGYETTRNIRDGKTGKENALIPIVALTANALKGDREKCLAAGMNDYLSKPLAIKTLEDKLNYWSSQIVTHG